MYCIKCGAKNNNQSTFCHKCGLRILQEEDDLELVSDKHTKTESMAKKRNESLFGYFLICLKRYADFSGRARRKEYWSFLLFTTIISFAITILSVFLEALSGNGESEQGVIQMYFSLFTILPHLAVTVRRMHDVNKSGWYGLVPFYNIYLVFKGGTKGDNRYGSDPKSE